MIQTNFRRIGRLAASVCGCLVVASAASAQYTESFDSTSAGDLPGGWTSTTSGIPGWRVVSDSAHSGSNAVWVDDPVSTTATATLTLPSIVAAGPVSLNFWNKHTLTTINPNHSFAVHVSINGGAFTNIGQGAWRQNGYNTVISVPASPLNGQRGFSNTFTTWTERTAVVSANPGDVVVFQFVLGLAASSASGHLGVWLDDISVTSSALGACCLPDGSCIFDTPANCSAQGGTFNSAAACASAVCLHQAFTEAEPNSTKASPNIVELVNQGDYITGVSTGSSTADGDVNTFDYYIVKTPALPPGIYRHRLSCSTNDNITSIVGSDQVAANPDPWTGVNGALGLNDRVVQTSTPLLTSPPRMNQWYGFGQQEQIILSVSGTSAMTAPYQLVWSMQAVTPTDIGAFGAGQIDISTVDQGHTTDTDMWVYSVDESGNLTAIPGFGNNDASPNGGALATSSRSFLRRTYAPGTYCLAITRTNLANNMGSPSDDNSRAGVLMDYPNAIAASGADRNLNMTFSVTDAAGSRQTSATRVDGYDINWYRFTVVPVGACCAAGGSCTMTTQSLCTAGTFFADQSACEPNPCAPASQTCCRGTTCNLVNAGTCTGIVAGSASTVVPSCGAGASIATCCYADFNHDGSLSIDDLFLYLNAYFMSSPWADVGGNGTSAPTIDDLFLYINAYFTSCS